MATVSEQEFMDIVHNYRAVWNRGCYEFKDRNKKSNAWMEIARLAGVDVKAATTRYETVISAFSRYLQNNKPPSGSGRDHVVMDSRWEHLRWLVPFIKQRGYHQQY